MNKEIILEAHFLVKKLKYASLLGATVLPILLWYVLREQEDMIVLAAVIMALIAEAIAYVVLDRVSKMVTHFVIQDGIVTKSFGLPHKMKEIETFSTKQIVLEKKNVSHVDEGTSIRYTLTNADGHNTILPSNDIERLIEFFELVPKENSENIWVSSEE